MGNRLSSLKKNDNDFSYLYLSTNSCYIFFFETQLLKNGNQANLYYCCVYMYPNDKAATIGPANYKLTDCEQRCLKRLIAIFHGCISRQIFVKLRENKIFKIQAFKKSTKLIFFHK